MARSEVFFFILMALVIFLDVSGDLASGSQKKMRRKKRKNKENEKKLTAHKPNEV